MKYCQNCGEQINDNAVICVKCGCSVVGRAKKARTKSAFYFILSISLLVLSAISAFVANYIDSTQLSGNAVAAMRTFGNYAGVRANEIRGNMQLVFAYAFLLFLALGLIMLIIGIVKKAKRK